MIARIHGSRALLLLAIALGLVGCGASAREKALHAVFEATNGARAGFETFDSAHQAQIVNDAKSFDEGEAALKSYRHDRETVLVLFNAVYQGIIAAVLVNDDPRSLPSLIEAAGHLRQALDALMKPKP